MALRKFDSCNHYATADIIKKWPFASDATIVSGGRRGGNRLRGDTQSGTIATIIDSQQTWIVGTFLEWDTLTTNLPVILLYDDTTCQACVALDGNGKIQVYRGKLGTLLGTTESGLFPPGSHYLEFKAKIHGSTGTFEVRLDGLNILSDSGLNTQATANATANKIVLVGPNFTGGQAYIVYYSDIYICDGSGSAPCNDFLGDCKVMAQFPIGNGTTNNFVGSDSNSTDNYLLVDETAPNTSDWTESSTPGDLDLYAVTDISDSPAVIYGVQTVMYIEKTDAGARTVSDCILSAGTNFQGTEKELSTNWQYLCEIHETNPYTEAAWTKDNFNSAEFGPKVRA
jgi:hypothetical protein